MKTTKTTERHPAVHAYVKREMSEAIDREVERSKERAKKNRTNILSRSDVVREALSKHLGVPA